MAEAAKNIEWKVIFFDIKSDRVEYAKRILKDLELSNICEIICGDAKECGRLIEEDIALLFIDGLREEYFEYLKSFEGKLIEGSLILAHNTVSHPYKLADYIRKVYSKGFFVAYSYG